MGALAIGLNGCGRVGRAFLRALHARRAEIGDAARVVLINDPAPPATIAHLLRYDSVHGRFPDVVRQEGDTLWLGDGPAIRLTAEESPRRVPWRDAGVHVVVEASGRFLRRADVAGHLHAGAPVVVVTAPLDDADALVCVGVNDAGATFRAGRVFAMASCTTHCLAPVARVLDGAFGVAHGLVSTVHAFTADQRLVDGPHEDLRRARAASLSIVPARTRAAHVLGRVLPGLEEAFDGLAYRVPTPDVSLADLTVLLARPADVAAVNDALAAAAADPTWTSVLAVTREPLVSVDLVGTRESAVVDLTLTRVRGPLCKVVAWYDNECGFGHRVLDLVLRLAAARGGAGREEQG
jgi:glyceraldehyde 3-phosphate dehydrogenase